VIIYNNLLSDATVIVICAVVVTEYLDVLEIPRENRGLSIVATEDEGAEHAFLIKSIAKSNFRRLSKKHHPDHGGNPEEFRILKEAHDAIQKARLVKLSDIGHVIGINIFSGVFNNGWQWVID